MNREKLKSLQKRVTQLRAEGKYKETIEECFHLLKYGNEFQDYKSILTAHINTAASYYCIGDIEEALKSIELYDKICFKYGDDNDKLNLYNTLFILYEYNNDLSKAKETLEKAIELGRKLEHYNIVSNAYSNFSHILIKEFNYEEALKMAKLGLEMAKLHKPESSILEIRVKLNLVLALIGLKRFDDSKILLDEMTKANILDSFVREKAQCHMLEGEWYYIQKQTKKAFESLTDAKKLVEEYGDLRLLKQIQEKRCDLCEMMGDLELGYQTQKEFIKLLKLIREKELELTALKFDIQHNISNIERKANTDYLTGLYNRSYLETSTDHLLKVASTTKESIVCIVFDIDNFKGINDQYGHLFGDRVLVKVARASSNTIRGNDLIGRYGGDEFVIILRNSSLEDGCKIAERIKASIGNLDIEKGGKNISVKASMGIADNLNGAILSFNDLFHLADMRLYNAKAMGKDQICISG